MKEIQFEQIEQAIYNAINEAACSLNQFTLSAIVSSSISPLVNTV